MLSALLLPALRERFPDRGLVEGIRPEPVAFFPGLHPGIRSVSIYDDGDQLTVSIDEITHGHFSEYDTALGLEERECRVVDAVVSFLDKLFADRIVVWEKRNQSGWFYPEHSSRDASEGATEFVWTGPRSSVPREIKD
jgi:hypothetical protein